MVKQVSAVRKQKGKRRGNGNKDETGRIVVEQDPCTEERIRQKETSGGQSADKKLTRRYKRR